MGALRQVRRGGCTAAQRPGVASRICIAAGVPLAQQQIVLEFRMDCTVATHDDSPVVLGRMPDSFVRQLG